MGGEKERQEGEKTKGTVKKGKKTLYINSVISA